MAEVLTVMSGFAVQSALEGKVIPDFTARMGIQVNVRWDPTVVILEAIAAGDTADIVIVTDEAIRSLVDRGICRAETVAPLAFAVLGIAVAKDAKKPDIGTIDALRHALLAARSVTYSQAGASGIYFQQMIERLGCAEQVLARATVIAKGLTAERLVTGEADLAVQQISELMMVEDVDIVGELPFGVQSTTGFSAAILSHAIELGAAWQFMDDLVSPQAASAYAAAGLTPALVDHK